MQETAKAEVFGFLRNFSFTPFKPFPSHEHLSVLFFTDPVVIRGFCFILIWKTSFLAFRFSLSDVRVRDNGPLPALGWGAVEKQGEPQSAQAGQVGSPRVCENGPVCANSASLFPPTTPGH